ncbi:MAG TPA: acyl-CoA dehydrogenase [Burkholderiaceae bacterium]|nr:acyl-CoA dehydrogenase [Burkholderiaceae bacterium]
MTNLWLTVASGAALPLGLWLLVYLGARVGWVLAFALAWTAAAYATGLIGATGVLVATVLLLVPLAVLALVPLRRGLLSRPLLRVFRRLQPAMSPTERDAIEAGTVWWDAELFTGRPRWDRLLAMPAPRLTDEEQAFLDHEVEHLCDLANDWETTQVWQDLSPAAWQYAKQAGFLGLIIPKEYGGKGFSAYAHSQVVMKLATRCSAATVSVMVPNSLGPAELLLHYGTEAQKRHYLPRLARGEEIPCFALTSPYAGSDAAAIPDVGIVCKGLHEGREVLGFSLTWNKRYITLAPIATVLGLAFRAHDPLGLLGGEKDLGITCALIPARHPGVQIGRRHWPLNAVFQNGPTCGKDVFIPLDWVIGGREQIGRGWRMLMECLAAGRCISLPSSNVGLGKLAVRTTGAYSALRRQFKTSIGRFEGVQEVLGRMGGHLYAMDATRRFAALAVDLGERPSVVSAIAKYHVTERARMVVSDAMDVVAGKGICMGPHNFIARAWQQLPIAITVEGANIMTRSLIIFGQGLIRCHPWVLRELQAAGQGDAGEALREFDRAVWGHAAFVLRNAVRALVDGLTGGRLLRVPRRAAPVLKPYYRDATRLATALALVADASLFALGARLKRAELVTARLGDVLSQLLIASATLKRYEDELRRTEDLPLVHWAVRDALARAWTALDQVLLNHPVRMLGRLLRRWLAPWGLPDFRPADRLAVQIAEYVQTPGEARDRLLAGSYVPAPEVDEIGHGEVAFRLHPRVVQIERRLREHPTRQAPGPLPQDLRQWPAWAREAEELRLVDAHERALLEQYAHHCEIALKVDDFPPDFGLLADLRRRGSAVADTARRAA